MIEKGEWSTLSIQFLILIIYFIFIILLGLLAVRKVKGSEDLLVAGRNLGVMFVAVSVAAEYMGGLGTVAGQPRLLLVREWALYGIILPQLVD